MSESGEIGPKIEQVEQGPKKITDAEIVSKFPDDWKFMDDLSLELDDKIREEETEGTPTVGHFIDIATKEQDELGDSPLEIEEVIAALRETDENSPAAEEPEHHESPGLPIYEPALQESDYHQRARALIETVDKWREDPESISFEDLEDILTGEEEDLRAKEAELREKKTYPIYKEWFRLEHSHLNYIKRIAGLMKSGEAIEYEDVPGANALNDYIREKLALMEDGESDALKAVVQIDDELGELQEKPDRDAEAEGAIVELEAKKAEFNRLFELSGGLIPVFEIFYNKTFDYPTAEEDDWDDDEDEDEDE